jgi:hypothetical protein
MNQRPNQKSLPEPYLQQTVSKMVHKGGGEVKKVQKMVLMVCEWPLLNFDFTESFNHKTGVKLKNSSIFMKIATLNH